MAGWRAWWAGYEKALARAPVLTQSLVGGGLWAAGDLAVQEVVEDSHPGAPDLRRVALAGAYGFGFVGPVGGAWYAWLERASSAWRSSVRPGSPSPVFRSLRWSMASL